MLHHFLRSVLFLAILANVFVTPAFMLRLENVVIVTRGRNMQHGSPKNHDATQRKFHVLKM
jgi:hypothetical protein